jgi:hypothetical protein
MDQRLSKMNDMGSWEMPSELVLLQETARRFMEKVVLPE